MVMHRVRRPFAVDHEAAHAPTHSHRRREADWIHGGATGRATMDSTAPMQLELAARWAAPAWAFALLIVVPMLALASALGTDAIIFPEGAALAMGIWTLALPGWAASRWRIAVLPALCALIGVGIMRLHLSGQLEATLAAAIALLILQTADSRLAPSMSAAVLPIVFGVDRLSYPLAVLVNCVVIAAAMPWLSRRRGPPPAPGDAPGRYPWNVIVGAFAAIVVWRLLGGELLALPVAALAPPLFVSALEWLGQRACTVRRGLRRWALLVGAALSGALAADLIGTLWLAGAVAVVATLVVMWLLTTPHPPALAITLIPLIPGASTGPVEYTLAIAAGAAALYLLVLGVDRVVLRPARPAAAGS
jgi:hypothetical protein